MFRSNGNESIQVAQRHIINEVKNAITALENMPVQMELFTQECRQGGQEWGCIISLEIIEDPVQLNGRVYERIGLAGWLAGNMIDPFTNLALSSDINVATLPVDETYKNGIRAALQEYKAKTNIELDYDRYVERLKEIEELKAQLKSLEDEDKRLLEAEKKKESFVPLPQSVIEPKNSTSYMDSVVPTSAGEKKDVFNAKALSMINLNEAKPSSGEGQEPLPIASERTVRILLLSDQVDTTALLNQVANKDAVTGAYSGE